MVKRKDELTMRDWLAEHSARMHAERPVVKSRWFVVEITPAKRIWVGDGHGGSDSDWTDELVQVVSPNFDEEQLAEQWLEQHEPDEGKRLEIRKQNLRRRIYEEWVNW